MSALYLDIETIPTAREDVCAYFEESLRDELQAAIDSVCAPANYKDADKIAEYCANKKAQLKTEFADKLAERIRSTGLDGSFGRVCCIGWSMGNDSGEHYTADAEADLLREFSDRMNRMIGVSDRFTAVVVGHNVQWDVRFLTQRYIVNGIRPPMVISRAAQAKPWEGEKLFDTMVQWAGVGGKISLDRLCLALSVPSPKGEIDGSKVAEFVAAGRIKEVAEYCARDVAAVRAIHERMTFATALQFDDVPA